MWRCGDGRKHTHTATDRERAHQMVGDEGDEASTHSALMEKSLNSRLRSAHLYYHARAAARTFGNILTRRHAWVALKACRLLSRRHVSANGISLTYVTRTTQMALDKMTDQISVNRLSGISPMTRRWLFDAGD